MLLCHIPFAESTLFLLLPRLTYWAIQAYLVVLRDNGLDRGLFGASEVHALIPNLLASVCYRSFQGLKLHNAISVPFYHHCSMDSHSLHQGTAVQGFRRLVFKLSDTLRQSRLNDALH